jgi:hypothetical protein
MTTRSWLLLAVFLVVLFATVRPLGLYIARLIEGGPRTPLLARLEEGVFRLCGIREEMGWRQYTLAVLVFSVIGAVAVYALQRLQPWLPLNPQATAAVAPDSALQHRDQLRDQYQLAGLRRRRHDELPDADARRWGCRTSCRRPPASPWRSH